MNVCINQFALALHFARVLWEHTALFSNRTQILREDMRPSLARMHTLGKQAGRQSTRAGRSSGVKPDEDHAYSLPCCL